MMRRRLITYSLAEYELMMLYQKAHGISTTDEGDLNLIHDEVMKVAEDAVEGRRKREN